MYCADHFTEDGGVEEVAYFGTVVGLGCVDKLAVACISGIEGTAAVERREVHGLREQASNGGSTFLSWNRDSDGAGAGAGAGMTKLHQSSMMLKLTATKSVIICVAKPQSRRL